MSRVNLKLKFQKGNLPPDVGRLQEENLRETFHEQLDIKLKSLKFDIADDGSNNFRKTICEVADGVLGKKFRTAARNVSEKLRGFASSGC